MASITLESVSVSFPIYDAGHRSLKKRLIGAGTGGQIGSDEHNRVVVEALANVSLDLRDGDRVALIGHNGAGKTTLLRVMAGIYEPLVGTCTIEGRSAPLFDAALGMDPDSTGYENVVLRGLYLGMSARDIEARMDEIAEFSELGPFLDMPIRTYSAGMQMRLAFAVSTSLQPEILLLDESVAAGDAAFMSKALARVDTLIASAAIVVFASHSMDLVSRFCQKACLLEHGRVQAMGELGPVCERYFATVG